MDTLRAVVDRIGFALFALFCAALSLLVAFGGLQAWGDYRVTRTKKEILHDPTHDPKHR